MCGLECQKDVVFKLILSFILGGIVGLEREHLKAQAGLRTHILVCLGSTLAALTSYYIRGDFDIQSIRIASAVVTGIGFIGAGTIMKYGATVKGLTTAASLWVVAVMGIAIGVGFYFAAVVVTFLILLSLLVLRKVEYKYTKD